MAEKLVMPGGTQFAPKCSDDDHRDVVVENCFVSDGDVGDVTRTNESIEMSVFDSAVNPQSPVNNLDSTSTKDCWDSSSGVMDEAHPVNSLHNSLTKFFEYYSSIMLRGFLVITLLAYTVYLGFAINHSVSMAMGFLAVTAFVIFCYVYAYIRNRYGHKINANCFQPVLDVWSRSFNTFKWFFYPALVIGLIMYLVFGVFEEPRQFQALSGVFIFIVWTYLTSKHPDKVNWRPVVWGFSLQFILGAMMLRWPPGYDAIKWCADVIVKFVNYGLDGAAYVFGDPFLMMHPFAFMGMPLVIYASVLMSMLYYYGITQIVVTKTCWFFKVTMATTTAETLGVSASIFLNGIDVMMMIRAYLTRLTRSEFHCFLVGGFAIVPGYAYALFVFLGAPPQHLLAAAVMSAVTVVAVAKLNYPETDETQDHSLEDIMWERRQHSSVFEVMISGAKFASKTVTVIVVNYITFVALLAWLDGALDYAATRVGYEHLDFELICSYVFWPIAWIMGVTFEHCRKVASLIGLKVCCSEILAFERLGELTKANALDVRSESIATYAICGFSGIPTVCIFLGVWNAVCPSRIAHMSRQMTRAIINANVCCFLTASIVGVLLTPEKERRGPGIGQRLFLEFQTNMVGWEDVIKLIQY